MHYAETLKHWRTNFLNARAEVVREYDEKFARMWEFYLSATEAAFRHGSAHVFQAQLTHKRDAVPLTRPYIEAQENTYKGREQVFLDRVTDATNTVFSSL